MSQNLYEILSVSIDDETHEADGQVERKIFLTPVIAQPASCLAFLICLV